MTMQVSDKGLLEIAEHEGIVPAPYRDSRGVWTWGVGHTSGAGGLDPREMNSAMPADLDATIDRALHVFREDLGNYAARVNTAIRVPLDQHQFDALVSFDFNTGGIHRAKLTRAINEGAPDASRHFMGWLSPPEIRDRRKAEMRLFETGDYDHNGDSIPVWKTNGAGKLVSILRVMHGADILMRMRGRRIPDTPAPAEPARPVTGFWSALIIILRKIFGGKA